MSISNHSCQRSDQEGRRREAGWASINNTGNARTEGWAAPHRETGGLAQRLPTAPTRRRPPSWPEPRPAGGLRGCPRPVRLRTEGRGLACPSPTPRHRADAHPSGWAHVWEHARALPLSVYTPPGSQHFIPHSRGDDSGDRETFKCGNASARTQPEKAKSNPKKERPRFSVIVTVILDEATFPRAV